MLKASFCAVWVLPLAIAAAASAETCFDTPLEPGARDYPVIVDTDEPREGPLVIGNCTLEPGADCPGSTCPMPIFGACS